MQQKYISKLSDIINTDVVRMINGQADVRQTSLKRICECLPKSAFDDKNEFIQDRPQVWDSCSLIILKNTLDGISFETTLNKLAIQIATGLQMEAKLGLFKETNKVQFKKVENALNRRNLPQNKKRYHHKERVWVYNMNKHNLDFKNWSKDDKIHLGAKCINYLELLGLVQHELRTTAKKRTIYYVTATEKMLEEIRNFNINNEALHPKYLPMIMPPKNWNSPFSGGYYGKKFNNENDKEKIANALQFDKSK